jgi:hypothetical protein
MICRLLGKGFVTLSLQMDFLAQSQRVQHQLADLLSGKGFKPFRIKQKLPLIAAQQFALLAGSDPIAFVVCQYELIPFGKKYVDGGPYD